MTSLVRPTSKPTDPTPRRSIARMIVELVLFVAVLSVPTVAVWSASSLAAYSNGPREASLALGALLFPVLPLGWELWAEARRRRRKATGPRILTLADRITLRTLTVSLAFLLPMLFAWPAPLFQALTTRGDWFLDDVEAPWAESGRHAVLASADGLVWLYDATHDNPWRDDGGTSATTTDGTGPGPMPTHDDVVVEPSADDAAEPSTAEPSTAEPSTGQPSTTEPSTGQPSGDAFGREPIPAPVPAPVPAAETPAAEAPAPIATPRPAHWPWPDQLHPLAHEPPATAAASIEALGAYFEAEVPDPTERAKAVHDWIADHVSYDAVSYTTHAIPPQTAESTFTTHTAVCAGYARLFEVLGTAAGLHVEVVVGDARGGGGEPEGHAWNAVELNGRWELVDTTWDAGTVTGTEFTRRYTASHFLVPGEVLGITHFPDDPRWQLRVRPLSRGEWNRQPLLEPGFFAAGLRLVTPDRAQIDAGPSVSARIESDGLRFMLASVEPVGGGARTSCRVSGSRTFEVLCELPARGAWTVNLFTSPVRYGMYAGVGSFDVNYL